MVVFFGIFFQPLRAPTRASKADHVPLIPVIKGVPLEPLASMILYIKAAPRALLTTFIQYIKTDLHAYGSIH